MTKYSNDMFVNNIRQLAKVKDIRIGTLESIIGVSTGYFSKVEKRNVDIALGTAVKVAKVLGCTLDELVLTDIGLQIEMAELKKKKAELEKKMQALKGDDQND